MKIIVKKEVIMSNKKILVFVLLFIAQINVLCAKTGVLSGAKGKLRQISTVYFDIIYPPSCEASAKKLALNADDMYLEICSVLKTESYQRFPVTLTNQVESLNAYFTSYPNNRIVLYDTPSDENLDMFGDTLLSVFYHELTHAVTLNIKSPTFRILSTLFTQVLTPANLTLTSFWTEGAAVLMESRKGEGRLNDPFALLLAYEAKAEGKKISWRDVTGARDTFPGGNDAYIFGAMFSQYLVDKYGEEKYAEFWRNAGSKLPISFVAGIFEDTYGQLITTEWNLFLETLETASKNPDTTSSRFEADTYRGKMRLTAMDSVGNTLVYADSSRSAVFISHFDGEKYSKAKKLLSIRAVQSLHISSDEKTLFIEHYTTRSNTKCETVAFDLEKKRVISTALYGVDGKKREGDEQIFCEQNEVFFAGEMVKPMIVKRDMHWAIRLEGEDGYSADFSLSRDVIIHDLHIASASEDKLELLFSFVPIGKEKVFPRAALATISIGDDGAFIASAKAMSEDFIGGVQNVCPTALYTSETPLIFYKTSFYEKSAIYMLDFSKVATEEISLSAATPEEDNKANELLSELASAEKKNEEGENIEYIENIEKNYNFILPYFKNHAILPSATLVAYNRKLEVDEDVSSFLGLSYISANEWGGNIFLLSGGYDFEAGIGGGIMQMNGGNDAIKYSIASSILARNGAFMQTAESAELAVLLFSRFISSVSTGVKAAYLYGGDRESEINYTSHYTEGILYATYTNVHKVGSPYEMNAGFSFTPFLRSEYFYTDDYEDLDIEAKAKYINAGATLAIRVPFIAPLSLSATFFPSSEYFASGEAKVYLACFEVQKGIPAISIFVNRVVLSASYSAKIKYIADELFDIQRSDEIVKEVTIDDYRDTVSATLSLEITPNTGALTAAQMSLDVSYFYRPHHDEDKKASGVRFGLKSTL